MIAPQESRHASDLRCPETMHVTTRRVLLILWLAFLLRGIFYCTVLPLWEGFDEWAHFAVIQQMKATNSFLVDRNNRVHRH